jgi:hypothetical protein
MHFKKWIFLFNTFRVVGAFVRHNRYALVAPMTFPWIIFKKFIKFALLDSPQRMFLFIFFNFTKIYVFQASQLRLFTFVLGEKEKVL